MYLTILEPSRSAVAVAALAHLGPGIWAHETAPGTWRVHCPRDLGHLAAEWLAVDPRVQAIHR